MLATNTHSWSSLGLSRLLRVLNDLVAVLYHHGAIPSLSEKNEDQPAFVPTKSKRTVRTIVAPMELSPTSRVVRYRTMEEDIVGFGRGALLWLLGVPLPVIVLLALFWHH